MRVFVCVCSCQECAFALSVFYKQIAVANKPTVRSILVFNSRGLGGEIVVPYSFPKRGPLDIEAEAKKDFVNLAARAVTQILVIEDAVLLEDLRRASHVAFSLVMQNAPSFFDVDGARGRCAGNGAHRSLGGEKEAWRAW